MAVRWIFPILAGLCLLPGVAQVRAATAVEEAIRDCEDCHGKSGASQEAEVPIIGGMSEFYLDEQMRAFRDKARPCETLEYVSGDHPQDKKTDMCAVAKEVSDAQLTEILGYFARQPWQPARAAFDQAKAETGRKVHEYYCEKCHTDGGSVAADDAGILAGQYRHYLQETFRQYNAGERWMPEKMQPKMDELKPEHVEALIEFYVSKGHTL